MHKFGFVAGAMALAVAACGPEQRAPTTAGISADGYRGATVETSGGDVRVTRVGESSNQGVTIVQAPVSVTFTVQGEGARIRARQDGQWIEMPADATNTVMLGRGGATAIRVFSRNTPELVVHVTGVTPCGETTCTPLVAPPAAETPDEDSDPAPAARP